MKHMKTLLLAAATAFVGVIAQADSPVVVGVFLPLQTPRVDDLVAGRTEDQYGMPVWRAYQRGEVPGARVKGVIFLSTDGREQVIFRGMINGHKYVSVGRSAISQNTLLCVAISGKFVAHQRVAAGPGTMCQAGIDAKIRSGLGGTENSAVGVIAIVPAGN